MIFTHDVARPFQFTEHRLVYDHTIEGAQKNTATSYETRKDQNKITEQLSHWPLPDESIVFRPDINLFNSLKLINGIYTNKAKNNKQTIKKHYVQIQSQYTSITLQRVVIIKRR